jgi:hypothetical protein
LPEFFLRRDATSFFPGWGDTAASSDANNNKGDSGCRYCKEEGHFARDCPKKAEKKSGCFKCGEEGHNKADCPQAGGDDDRPKGCFKCKSLEHKASECELPDKCRLCGEEGHMSKECSNGAKTHTIEKEDGTKHEVYFPTEVNDDDLFSRGIDSGINFDKFDAIPVKILFLTLYIYLLVHAIIDLIFSGYL